MTGNGERECILERDVGNNKKSQIQKWRLFGHMPKAKCHVLHKRLNQLSATESIMINHNGSVQRV